VTDTVPVRLHVAKINYYAAGATWMLTGTQSHGSLHKIMERFLINYKGPSAKKLKTTDERLQQQREYEKNDRKKGDLKVRGRIARGTQALSEYQA
jgi:hypothetical protein